MKQPDLWTALGQFRARVVDQLHPRLNSLPLDLSLPQAMALSQVAEVGPLTVGELTKRLGRSQATTSHLIAQLEKKGLLERRDDPADARRTTVAVAKAGAKLLARLEQHRRDSFERVLGPLPAPVRNRLEAALRETLAALEAHDAKRSSR